MRGALKFFVLFDGAQVCRIEPEQKCKGFHGSFRRAKLSNKAQRKPCHFRDLSLLSAR